MSTDMTWQTSTTSSEATEQLARSLGQKLRGGEVIELRSDLGGGKTTFVRGLAAGAGSTDAVASPSFTISKVYATPELEIHHYDLYRLPEVGLMGDELADVMGDPHNVVVVEWADVAEDVLPASRVVVEILATGENDRRITVTLPKEYEYLKVENV